MLTGRAQFQIIPQLGFWTAPTTVHLPLKDPDTRAACFSSQAFFHSLRVQHLLHKLDHGLGWPQHPSAMEGISARTSPVLTGRSLPDTLLFLLWWECWTRVCVHEARSLGCKFTLVVPLSTSEYMIAKILQAGASTVIQEGNSWAEADAHLKDILMPRARELGINAVYVHPFDHEDIWDGHFTMIDEVVRQLQE
ncbi:hypothetical protein A1O3_06257 [Capronia epimyces CBS 606.96]|uniref:L-serine ammonia-lyase n=1 Tax=Capronia epimyces CBS 606.96 TaxID=1182542 RepID=W9YJK3_9EURO|nr:uncharacterized protein A1O3_06257 [Capronia epimyces CBS 606.96]EXJ82444.1 hypothetical protein A1O3_06257 [Capronia epimyces CBS 606.96]